ncbi:hypothetical protein [Parvibaculum sp.]|uniref:hypothetical protein n=1 Tax=Parvibaculum sp. TaxID=2024848 RepID=UPI00320D9761
MKLIRFGVMGIALQGMGLAAFILISRTSVATIGKPAVIGLTVVSVASLLWRSVTQAKTPTVIFLLPALLALGYAIAFHVVGVFGFRGLLRDAEFSVDYLLSVLRVTGIVFVLYAIGTASLYFVGKK